MTLPTKHLLALILSASLLSGCCEMAYGPTQCRKSATEYLPEQPFAEPPSPSASIALAPQANLQPQFVPQSQTQSAPQTIIVRAPFMMGPSINGAPTNTLDKPKKSTPAKAAPAAAPADSEWLRP